MKRLLCVILAAALSLSLTACKQNTEASYAGRQLETGLLDATEPVTEALGNDLTLLDAAFMSADTLILAAEGADGSTLAVYDCVSGSITASCELAFSLRSAKNTVNTGLVTVCESGVAVADPIKGSLTIYDFDLNERFSKSCGFFAESDGSILSLGYSEAENALFYCFYAGGPVIYRFDAESGKSSELFRDSDEKACLSFTMSENGSRLNVRSTDFSEASSLGRSSDTVYYILDAQDGATLEESWLGLHAVSDGDAIVYDGGAYSRAVCGGNVVQADFAEEYGFCGADSGANLFLTGVCAGNENGGSLMLSAYDFPTGSRSARCVHEFETWPSINDGVFPSDTISVNGAGRCCLVLGADGENGDSARVLIWTPAESGDDDEAADLTMRAENTMPAVIDDEAVRDYTAQLEEKYDVEVLTGAEAGEYNDSLSEPAQIVPFGADTDPNFVYELLCTLDAALARYPDGVIQKISGAADGKLHFVFIKDISMAETQDSNIIGRYVATDGTQNVYVEAIPALAGNVGDMESSISVMSIIHHEIGHAIQRMIFENTQGKTVYDYETYISYWPAEFDITAASNAEEYVYTSPDEQYFTDEYAMSSLLEDMSRLFEYSMWETPPEMLGYPHIQARYAYLCELMRTVFEDQIGSDTPCWERALTD